MLDKNYKALEWCIYRRVPFCMFCRPEDRQETFFAAPSLLENLSGAAPAEGFFISPFNVRFAYNLWIPFECDADTVLQLRNKLPENKRTDPPIERASTTYDEYTATAKNVIDRINSGVGLEKLVLSVVETRFMPEKPAAERIRHLFEKASGTFRHCYYHPLTGFWMGASPELLLACNLNTGKFRTMALAGTCEQNAPEWSSKNVHEHNVVKDYIERCLCQLHIAYNKGKTIEKKFGYVVHLCTEFQGKLQKTDPVDLIDRLNPTPALCGNPLTEAVREIDACEKHPRRCYGGYVGVRTDARIDAYVNIRCANFEKSNYCFYTGSGLVSLSQPQQEWTELTDKHRSLMDLMN